MQYADDWEAWQNIMPGARHSIMVTGCCELPTTGYHLQLRKSEPQGINPQVLELDLIVHDPTGPVLNVITHERAIYFEYTEMEYGEVHINPDGAVIKVQLA